LLSDDRQSPRATDIRFLPASSLAFNFARPNFALPRCSTHVKLPFPRILLLPLALALLLAPGLSAARAAAPAKPNIIFILADDVGLGNIGCYGGAFKTPHIDALAAGGTRFEYCYANPLCGPSRATCLTGRYVFRTGMLTNGSRNLFRSEEIMVPKVLKPAGYVTAAIGKWAQLPLDPPAFGFDEYLRFQNSGKYWASQDPNYTQDGQPKPLGDRYLPDVMHEYLVDFMRRHRDQPFYVHYALSHMHARILRTPDSAPNSRDFYADNNAYMDKLVGRLVAALDELKLREKTLLVFVGDNGTAPQGVAAATVQSQRIAGQKGTMLEGGSRVPFILNWPGVTPAGKVLRDLTDFTDFLPTFAELGGAPLPPVKLDGHSFAPQAKGQPGTPREWVFVQLGGARYVRDARWKLTGEGALFDLKEAPFRELPVPADATDPGAAAARTKLQAALDSLHDESGPPIPNRRKKKKQRTPAPAVAQF
jgi:arylsulfatase A